MDLDSIVTHKHVIDIIKQTFNNNTFYNILFTGPPGVGKTLTARLLSAYIHKDDVDMMVMEINAAEERCIDVIKNKVGDFSKLKNNGVPRIIILDEFDNMTSKSQKYILHMMDMYKNNVIYIIICNKLASVNRGVMSRCIEFTIDNINTDTVDKYLSNMPEITISERSKETLLKLSKGDMRDIIQLIQYHKIVYGDDIKNKNLLDLTNTPSDNDMYDFYDFLVEKNKSKFANEAEFCNYISINSLDEVKIFDEIFDMVLDNKEYNIDFIEKISYIYVNKGLINKKKIIVSGLTALYQQTEFIDKV